MNFIAFMALPRLPLPLGGVTNMTILSNGIEPGTSTQNHPLR